MTTRRDVDVAWAAGIWEGEGCFSVYQKPTGAVQIQCIISMTDQDVIDRFAEVMGFGNRAVRQPSGSFKKVSYLWRCNGIDNLMEMVRLFVPYMGERRKERVREIMQLWASHEDRRTKRQGKTDGRFTYSE